MLFRFYSDSDMKNYKKKIWGFIPKSLIDKKQNQDINDILT